MTEAFPPATAPLEAYDSNYYALRSARVILPRLDGAGFEEVAATVVVRDGRIDAVHRGVVELDCDVRDLGRVVLLPGVVDASARFGDCGDDTAGDCWEGFAIGTRSAAAGGITTTIDLPSNDAERSAANDVRRRTQLARGVAHVDVGLAVRLEPSTTQGELESGAIAVMAHLTPPSGATAACGATEFVRHVALPVLANTVWQTAEALEAASPFRLIPARLRPEAKSPLMRLPLCRFDEEAAPPLGNAPALRRSERSLADLAAPADARLPSRDADDDAAGDAELDRRRDADLLKDWDHRRSPALAAAPSPVLPRNASEPLGGASFFRPPATPEQRADTIWDVLNYKEEVVIDDILMTSPHSPPGGRPRSARDVAPDSPPRSAKARRSAIAPGDAAPGAAAPDGVPEAEAKSGGGVQAWVRSLLQAELNSYRGAPGALEPHAESLLDALLGYVPPALLARTEVEPARIAEARVETPPPPPPATTPPATPPKPAALPLLRPLKSALGRVHAMGRSQSGDVGPAFWAAAEASASAPSRRQPRGRRSAVGRGEAAGAAAAPGAPLIISSSSLGNLVEFFGSKTTSLDVPAASLPCNSEELSALYFSSRASPALRPKARDSVVGSPPQPDGRRGPRVPSLDGSPRAAPLARAASWSVSEDSAERTEAPAPAAQRSSRPPPITIFKENDMITRRAIRNEYALYCHRHASDASARGLAEWLAVVDDADAAKPSGVSPTRRRLHVDRASTLQITDLLRRQARRTAFEVTGGVAAYYLVFAEEDVTKGATKFKLQPPLRHEAHRQALWAALREGVVSVVASGHSPVATEGKLTGGNFVRATAGTLGGCNEVLLPALWTAARREGFDLAAVANWLCAAPAMLLGLDRKGAIRIGADADFVLFDPDANWVVDAAALQSAERERAHCAAAACRRPPRFECLYEGLALTGAVVATVLRGQLVFSRGKFRDAPLGQVLLAAPAQPTE